MKKLFCFILCISLLCALAACGNSSGSSITRIAIVQQMDHSSLDEIRAGIEAELQTLADKEGMTIEIKVYNGQNDATVLSQIAATVVSENYDAIIPIATLAAQCVVTAAEDTDIPIIFAAVSDPEGSGLTGIPTVTGVSDALNTPFILDMMFAADPDIKTVGLLYSNSESNSELPVAQAKAYLDSKGIAYLEKTGTTTDEILTAASTLAGRVDAVFTPTDNVVMGTANAVAEILNAAGIPYYAGADSFVIAGAFATCGVNYTDLGTYAAGLAVDVLLTGKIPPYHVMSGGIITVNTDTAAALKLDFSVFKTMANTVKEVVSE